MLATLALVVLAAWLLIAEPLLGRRTYRQLMQALDHGDQGARRRFYRQWIWQGWLLVAITAVVAVAVVGWTPAALGLRWPHGSAAVPVGFIWGIASAMLAGAVIGLVAARRTGGHAAKKTPPVAGGANVLRMLPRGRSERWAFAALAITAGLGEEFVWRGFGVAVLQRVWPQADPVALVLLLAIPFGWAHLYQGWSGVLATGVIGALMAGIYLASGSLLIPMLLHVLIDLRALLIPVPPDAAIASAVSSPHAADAASSFRDR